MRPFIVVAALALRIVPAPAQVPAVRDTSARAALPDSFGLKQEIATRRAAGDRVLPDAASFTFGDRSVAEKTTFDGPVAVAHGNLDVYGTINGDAVTLDGDLRVHPGGRVTGDAWAVGGTVLIEGGVVEGEKRAFSAHLPASARTPTRPLTTAESVKLTIGWFALLMIIGLGVLIFADGNLDGVVLGLERGFAKAFWLGLAGQVLLLPILLVLVVALAITVIGVLLIPFAVVAYVVAAAGLVTLGFLAMARLTGGAFASDRGTTSPRGVHLRALFIGLLVYLGLWMIASLFTWNPLIGAVARTLAIAVTWVAATLGLGAAISSRAGTVRPGNASISGAADELSWQTPTPVTGVAAATRRVATSR